MTDASNRRPIKETNLIVDITPINTLTYTTEYHSAQVLPDLNGLSNVLVRIYCNLTAEDNLGNRMVAGSDIALDEPSLSSFVDYDLITKDQLDNWVKSTKDYHNLEQQVIIGMNSLVEPITIIKPLNF